jgi:hypothetical protein
MSFSNPTLSKEEIENTLTEKDMSLFSFIISNTLQELQETVDTIHSQQIEFKILTHKYEELI